MLIGHSFAQFYEDQQLFERQWRSFRERRHQRRHAEALCANGTKVIVNYAAANYLPGRHVIILCDITERVEAQGSLGESRERLQQISDYIHEVVWMMDAPTRKLLLVNRAYETITGRSLESVIADPSSYLELIHPADRAHVLAKLEGAVHSAHFDEEFRILRQDGEIRWVWVKANPLPHEGPAIRKLVGTAQDITAKKLADAQVAAHLRAAETARDQADTARAEAEALRKATLVLTQNLRMDAVLDTLLLCVREIIPYDSATVILAETDGRLFVARESPPAPSGRSIFTIDSSQDAVLQRVLLTKKNVHLPDTREDESWHESRALEKIGSWIAVPLVASDSVLGMLSIGCSLPRTLTTEHFRRAKSLAIPAAIAIQNARLYEWAEIYAAERQQLLKQADCLQNPESNLKSC
jgi:PAS domain S-box-containing protein